MRHLFTKLAPRHLAVLFATVLAVGLNFQNASAQVLYGSLVGNVTDQNGAVVPDARVTLTNKGTAQVRETTTNSEGEYSILNILPGIYDLKVTKQGFSTNTKTDVTVTANNALRLDAAMNIGNVNDVVSVTADATVLQTESASVKSEISAKEIQSLPINNYRNYQSLLNLVPGTTPAAFQNANTDTPERALTTNVNGTARNNNNTRLDGAQSVNIWLPHHSAYVPPSESVQEVNISTNNFDAEQGLAGGAAVQVITKSGTNAFHGSAFAYHDNHFFRAKNAFYPTTVGGAPNPNKPKNLRTIPGATFGGPIKRDKLFFFGSWEGMYESTIGDAFLTVPTAEHKAGNFSNANTTIYDPFDPRGNLDGTGRPAFAGAVIPTNRIHPAAAKLLALVPLPNLRAADGSIPTVNNYYAAQPGIFNRNNYGVKINFNRNESHQLWTKFDHMKADVTGNFALGDAGGRTLGAGGSGTGTTTSYVGTIGHTWTLANGFILDGNFSVTNRNHFTIPPDYGKNVGLDVLGIPGTNGPDIRQSGTPQFFFTNYEGLGNQNGWSPVFRDERSYTFTQNATKIFGSHDVRFGVDIVKHQLDHWQPEIGVGPRGGFRFSGATTALNGGPTANQFNSLAALLLGVPQIVQKSLQYEKMTTREWQIGFYVRDRWQAHRNLTLTLGVRYELFPTMSRADRGIERLDLNSPVVLDAAGRPNGVMNVLIGGKGSNPSDLGVGYSKKLFAPRLGFAYRLGDDTVIRGGYGLTYDPMPFGRPLRGFYPLTIAQQFVATAPGANQTFTPWGFTATSRPPGLTVGIPNFTGPDLSTGVVALPGTVEMRSPYEGTLKRGYIQSWNLMIERKLVKDIKVEVGYVGTGTRNQFGDVNINAAQAPNSLPFLQTKYGRTANTLMWDGFTSTSYHSLQVAVNRRYSNGALIKGAYTYSKAINFFDDSGWVGLPLFNAQSQIGRNRGLAGFDIPHNFTMGGAYELPFGKGKKFLSNGVAGKVLGGWALSGIASFVAGRPLTVGAGTGTLNAPGNSQTPDLIGKPSYPKATGPNAIWFDPNAFRLVEHSPEWLASSTTNRPFRFGTSGRSVLRGPGFSNIDLSLVRAFQFTERLRTEFRVDAFNFTNTPWYGNPGTNASSPGRDAQGNILRLPNGSLDMRGFGQVLSANQTQRQVRFGIRLEF